MSRWIRVITMTVAAMFFGVSVAHAQYPPAQDPTLVVSRDVGPPGYTFTATVTNCVPGQRVVFVLGDQRVEATCDPTTLQASARLAAPLGLGSFTVTAEFYGDCSLFPGAGAPGGNGAAGAAPCYTLSETIRVVDGSPPPAATTTTTVSGGGLANTGSSGIGTTTRSAVLIVVAGAGLFAVSRLRRRPAR